MQTFTYCPISEAFEGPNALCLEKRDDRPAPLRIAITGQDAAASHDAVGPLAHGWKHERFVRKRGHPNNPDSPRLQGISQNTYFTANCQMRGVPTDEVMRPNVAGLFRVACGLPRLK